MNTKTLIVFALIILAILSTVAQADSTTSDDTASKVDHKASKMHSGEEPCDPGTPGCQPTPNTNS